LVEFIFGFIFKQLQLEEALLRVDHRNWCILNQGSSDAIVMGISGKPHELINKESYSRNSVPVIRRFSGGGCVFVDHDTLFVSLICNHKAINIAPFPNQILCWTGDLYKPFFPNNSFQVRENDYVLGNHKFGGNAQYILRNRWLHHTTLLWDYCQEKMNLLSMPPKMPGYREKRPHSDFLCKLHPHFKSQKLFLENFIESLSKHFTVIRSSLVEATPYLEKPHRKATTLLEFLPNHLNF